MNKKLSIGSTLSLAAFGLMLSMGTSRATPVTYTFTTQDYMGGSATAVITLPDFATTDTSVSAPFPPGDSCNATTVTCIEVGFFPDLLGLGDDVSITSAENGGIGYLFPVGSFATTGSFDTTADSDFAGHLTVATTAVPEPASAALLIAALTGIGVVRRKRS